MKLPSIQYLVQSAVKSFLRFPFIIIAAFIGVCMGVYLTEFYEDITNIFPIINIMLSAGLGIGLFFCVDVYSYNKGFSRNKRLLFDLGALVVLVLVFFTLPDRDSTQNTSLPYIRYTIYAIAIHLVVAFIPFLGKGQLNGFWNYNKILFVRFLASLLYSGFLYAGLSIALGSLDFLFDIDLHSELFMDMFIVIAGLFNTWFFISGIPETFHDLDDVHEYPKGIKIFSQYILLPLLILYLVILYIYAGKIIVLWSWPKGLVSYLIACVAVLGILTILLIYPYGSLSGNTWIKKFSKWYYFILFPLVILLFIAIGMRVADYGITINRYCIILLGVWLTIVCIYFAIGRTNIKFIPVSLAVILIIVSFGYWGIFSVSERSQVNRLKAILTESKILQHEKIKDEVMWRRDSIPALYATTAEDVNESLLSDSLHNEVKSILDYLDDHHGFSSIRDWYHQNIDSIVQLSNVNKKRWYRMNEAEAYMRSLGLRYIHKYKSNYGGFGFDTNMRYNRVIDIHGYDYFITLNSYRDNDPEVFYIDSIPYSVKFPDKLSGKILMISVDTITFDLDILTGKLVSRYGKEYRSEVPPDEMILHGSNDRISARLQLHSISVYPENDSLEYNSINGDLLIKKN